MIIDVTPISDTVFAFLLFLRVKFGSLIDIVYFSLVGHIIRVWDWMADYYCHNCLQLIIKTAKQQRLRLHLKNFAGDISLPQFCR